mmetsp:Transcript_23476/g.25885  ORF Transcript_23476/g.25885 Transcript_23476/m.25885 type:complete len:86 (-) Transcript_23476:175-432(-)
MVTTMKKKTSLGKLIIHAAQSKLVQFPPSLIKTWVGEKEKGCFGLRMCTKNRFSGNGNLFIKEKVTHAFHHDNIAVRHVLQCPQN